MCYITADEARDIKKHLLDTGKVADFMPDGRFVTMTDVKEALDLEVLNGRKTI